jgi:hypothetical protein
MYVVVSGMCAYVSGPSAENKHTLKCGWSRGLQMVVEKMLAAGGESRQGLGRAAFEARVWQWKEQYGGYITGQLRRLGASCDWSRERFTLDSQLSGTGIKPGPLQSANMEYQIAFKSLEM